MPDSVSGGQLDGFFLQPSNSPAPAPVAQSQPAVTTPPPVSAPVAPAPAPQPPVVATPQPAPTQVTQSQVSPFLPAPPGVVIPPAYQPVAAPVPAAPQVVTPTAPVTPAPAQPTQQQVTDALAAAQAIGIDTSRFTSGADLVQTMWATVQSMNQEIEQYRAWQMQQQPARPAPATDLTQQPAAVPEAESFKWDVPPFDPSWERFVQRDEQGYFRALAPEYTGIAQKVNDYYQWRNKTADRLLTDFPTLVQQAVENRFAQQQQSAREMMQEQFRQWQYDQQVEAFEAELSPHLYQTDLRGQRALTPWGQQIIQQVEAYRRQGVQDPLWIMQQARAIVGAPPGQTNQLPVNGAVPGAVMSTPTGPAPVTAPPAAPQFPQPSMLPGTNFQVVPTLQLRAPDGRIVSPQVLSEQQKAIFLQQAAAARATHVPQVGTTPADVQSRPVTESDLNNWFLNPSGAPQ